MGDLGEEWDVDDYRGDHESDEHWTLRREFMVTNKGAFPRLRLLSLSQVFSNVEFMGCRYPEETMATVAELSTGIVEGYRAKQKSRLQRTFVKASAAAEAKSKRVFHSNNNSTLSSASAGSGNSTPSPYRRGPKRNAVMPDPPPKKMKKGNDTDLSTLVLVQLKYNQQESDTIIINQSCQMSGKEYKFEDSSLPNGYFRSVFKLGDFVVEGSGLSKTLAKSQAAERALIQLRKICYTLQINSRHIPSREDGIGKDVLLKRKQGGEHAPLQEDNVGNKLMRLMGYSGGALGKSGQGIEAPIDTSDSIGRQRLGLGCGKGSDGGNERLTHGLAVKFLEAQIQRPEWKDLVFAPELSNDERSIIHSAASRLGLKSRSYGKDSARFLVIGKKILLWDLLQELLASGNTERYQVFPPGGQEVNSESGNTS